MESQAISQSEMTQEVVRLLLEGNSMSDTIAYMQKLDPKLSTKEAAQGAFDWFEAAAAVPQNAKIGWCTEAYRELYRKMIEIGDFNGAVRCVLEISKLAGGKSAAKKAQKTITTTEETWIQEMERAS